MQQTLVLIKPDAVQRGLIGTILTRLERKGLKLNALKLTNVPAETWREHYSHIADKPFYPPLEQFMTSTPVVAMVWQGKDAVDVVRKLAGTTNAREAEVGTIRGDFAMSIQYNIIHASDGEEAAQAEIKRFFKDEEVLDYNTTVFDQHLYSGDEKS